jgi:hypothetical protein
MRAEYFPVGHLKTLIDMIRSDPDRALRDLNTLYGEQIRGAGRSMHQDMVLDLIVLLRGKARMAQRSREDQSYA